MNAGTYYDTRTDISLRPGLMTSHNTYSIFRQRTSINVTHLHYDIVNYSYMRIYIYIYINESTFFGDAITCERLGRFG